MNSKTAIISKIWDRLFWMMPILAVSVFFSCGGSKEASGIKGDTEVPQDFGKSETTLLAIRSGKRSYDDYLEMNLQKYYTGPYIIISRGESQSATYSDVNKYRYFFDRVVESERRFSGTGGGGYYSKYLSRFNVLDRATGVKYETKRNSANFSNLMIKYLKKLEAARKGAVK